MYLRENIFLALEGLKANKMRALLTMLGIIIGIGSVIGIMTVGDSLSSSVTSSMSELGATNIIVILREKPEDDSFRNNAPGPVMMRAGGSDIAEADRITDEMLERFQEIYGSDITSISLSSQSGSGKAEDGRLYANITIYGANGGYASSNNVDILEGRFIQDNDIKTSRSVAVVSDKFVNNMFSGKSPLGQEVKISIGNTLEIFSIIGVYKHVDDMMMGFSNVSEKDTRTNFYIPISTAQRITSADKGYSSFTVTAKPGTDINSFTENVSSFFNTFYKNSKYEVYAFSLESIMSTMNSVMSTLTIAVAVIAAISLVVGGIGVMNIMLVSVTERTREIGTRKALGGRNSAIRAQFVVEAIIICAIGGLFGILLGAGLGYIGSSLLGFPSFPTSYSIIIAVMFSMLIGVFFGYYPANKAAKLDPIEALRYE